MISTDFFPQVVNFLNSVEKECFRNSFPPLSGAVNAVFPEKKEFIRRIFFCQKGIS